MKSRGFSLVEVLVALLMLQIALLALVPLFILSSKSTASAADLGSAGAVAVERMEQLRQIPFAGLAAGGDLATDVAGYFDGSNPDFAIRWRITEDATPPTLKTIEVRVVARRSILGLPKEITLVNMEAE